MTSIFLLHTFDGQPFSEYLMSQSLEPVPETPFDETGLSRDGAHISRRHFMENSLAFLGALLIEHSASAQTLGTSETSATSISPSFPVIPHDVGLRTKPVASRAPLAPPAFLALPLGSVKAQGWLLRQLELQRDGLTGHADEIYDLYPATTSDSAWKGGEGEDWEKGPYYLKGLIALAYTLDDARLKAKVQSWIEPILASQREDGFFGPKNDDWWPRMVATYLLRDYEEATGDGRVLTLLTKYYRYMSANLPTRPLSKWGKARAGDEIDTMFWLYNRTGDEFLLPLADLVANQTYPWRQIFAENSFLEMEDEWMVTHNVNVTQALKMPAVYWQRSGRDEDRAAYRAGVTHLMRDHGTSFGINTGTEALAGRSSVEGVETCSTVEQMLSAETALRILGDARIGDELELVAFNALPAAFSSDFHQHVYYTLSNNVIVRKGKVGYSQDHGDDRVVAPRSGFPCCCYNMHMGWPKLAQNAWAATPEGGLAALVYVPSQVTFVVGANRSATITCQTDYPFDETIRLGIKVETPSFFPLRLRVPGWCKSPQIKVNGRTETKPIAGSFVSIEREWKSGDLVELTFPMTVETVRGINNSVSVRRGPVTYALGLTENEHIIQKNHLEGYESYELTTNSPWNYALEIDDQNPVSSFKVVHRKGNANPFQTGEAPVVLQVKARQVEQWKMRADNQLALEPPPSPVVSSAPVQRLELVPFGSQMLRVSEFPTVGQQNPAPSRWSEDFTDDYATRWVVHRGSFLRHGQLHLPKGAKGIAAAAVFNNFVYDATITIGVSGDAGVLFRTSNDSLGTDSYRGYYVGINAEKDTVFFGKADNNWKLLERANRKVDAEVTHHVRIEARGSQVKVWVDDMTVPVLEASDDTYQSGALGIRSFGKRASFGKLAARAL